MGPLFASEAFDRAEEDLGRELVIVIRASSYRLDRVEVFAQRSLAPAGPPASVKIKVESAEQVTCSHKSDLPRLKESLMSF